MFEYRLGCISSGFPQGLNWEQGNKPFTAEHYTVMRDKTLVLWDFYAAHMAWKVLLKNYDNFVEFMVSQEKPMIVSHQIYLVSAELAEMKIESLRLLMNFLASASAFLSLSEVEMRRVFPGEIFNAWDARRKALHLNSVSYRVGYEFRNYAQHYGFPMSEFGAHMSSTTFFKVDMVVHVKDLLSKGFNWNKKVVADLQDVPSGVVQLEVMVHEYFDCLKAIHRNSIDVYTAGLNDCAGYLNRLLGAYQHPVGHFPVVFISSRSNVSVEPTMEHVPLHLIKEISVDLSSQFGLEISSVNF